jgi:hypothetical protein
MTKLGGEYVTKGIMQQAENDELGQEEHECTAAARENLSCLCPLEIVVPILALYSLSLASLISNFPQRTDGLWILH